MVKSKQVRFGKVVKTKVEDSENKYKLSIVQYGKLKGQEQRDLKKALEDTIQAFRNALYEPSE